MTSSIQKSQSLSSERKPTTIFQQPFEKPPSVSHLPIFNLTINKENINSQKLGWDSYLKSVQFTATTHKKQIPKFVELQSQQDPTVKYKFPIYTDKELGIAPEIQNLLRESYDNDDDINTRESVMDFFVDVCKRDLIQGVRENKDQVKDKDGNPITNFAGLQNRLRELNDKMSSDEKLA